MARTARQLKLAGVFAATVTPRRAGSLDADFTGFLDLLDFLAQSGVDGICVLGSTGEFLNFSFSDRQRLVYLGSKRSRVPLMVGVGHSTLTGALQLADEAISAGADALLVMPPYFFRYSAEEVEEFYRQFAREAGNAVPLVLYNIPQFTSVIAFDTATSLLKSGLYAGIKDSSGDEANMDRLLALRREHEFALLAGNDRIGAQALSAGADGIVSGCACAIPELLVAMKNAVKGCDTGRRVALNAKLQEFIGWIEKFPVPEGIKKAVEVRKQKSAPPSAPLPSAEMALMGEFEAWLSSSAGKLWGSGL